MEYEYKYTENCWFEGSCPREVKQGCDPNCNIQAEFGYLLNTSNIPKDYMKSVTLYPDDADYEAFKTLATIKQDIESFVDEGRFIYIWGKITGNGKAQPLYSKVLTPNGYITMGEVKVGTEVIGEDGKPHKVLGVFPQGKKPVYELTFSDGSKCRCSDEHLWTVSTNHRKSWKTITLNEIMKAPLCYRPNSYGKGGKGWKYHIPITAPIEFSVKDELPIDPWLLGVLLGDGGLTGTSITLSNTEHDLLNKVNAKLSKYDCVLSNFGGCDYKIVHKSNVGNKLDIDNKVKNTVKNIINELGLLKHKSVDKFIPKAYLYSDVTSRISILQGLFDTGGTIEGGHNYTLSTSSKQLAKDIVFLVQSLGGTCSCNEHEAYYTHNGEKRQGLNYFGLYIKLPSYIVPYTTDKHKTRLVPAKRDVAVYRTLRNISYVGEEVCQCIYVDSESHLYITDDMIVTHNTTWATKLLKTYLAVKCVGNNFADRGWFEYVPSFLLLAKEFENSEARKEHIDNTMKRDLVILDDIGAVQNSNYDISTLSNIIDYRYSNGLATIITGNIEPAKLESSIGVRLADRVLSDIAIEFKGGSNRSYTNTYSRKG